VNTYDRRGFALAYADAQNVGNVGARRTSPLSMVFASTMRSYAAITGPMAGSLEAVLVHVRMEQAGIHESFLTDMGRIDRCNNESLTAHLDILNTLIGVLLGDNADRVVPEEELRAIGVQTTPPSPYDYEW
jgi:hypothetical protein